MFADNRRNSPIERLGQKRQIYLTKMGYISNTYAVNLIGPKSPLHIWVIREIKSV